MLVAAHAIQQPEHVREHGINGLSKARRHARGWGLGAGDWSGDERRAASDDGRAFVASDVVAGFGL
jgi:hypothetical protein